MLVYDYTLVEFIKSRGEVTKEDLLRDYEFKKDGQESLQLDRNLEDLIRQGIIEYDGNCYCFVRDIR